MSLSKKEGNMMSCNSGLKPVLIYFTYYTMPLNGLYQKLVFASWDSGMLSAHY